MTELELMESLYTQPWHICLNGEPEYSLRPPHRATDGWVRLHIGRVKYGAQHKWTLVDTQLDLIYCPWCGEKLPTEAGP